MALSIDRAVGVGGVVITLIGSGVAVLWPNRRLGWIFTGAGLFVFVLAMVWMLAKWQARKELEKERAPVGAAVPAPSQHLTQTANPHDEFNPQNVVNVHVPVSQAQSQHQTQSQGQTVQHVNLDFEAVRVNLDGVRIDPWFEIMNFPTDENSFQCQAAIVQIRRNLDDASIDWIDIRYRVELRAPGKAPILINEGRWLGKCRGVRHCSFSIHETRTLAVALVGEALATTYEGVYQDSEHPGLKEFIHAHQALDEPFYDVDLYLFGTKTFPREARMVVVEKVMRFELLIPERVFRPKA